MREIGIELFKIRTQRASVVILAFAVGLQILSFILNAVASQLGIEQGFPISQELIQRQLLSATGATVLILVFSAVGITGEYRHRTISSSFLASPTRYRMLLAKLAAYMIVAVVYGVIITIVTTAGVLLLLSLQDAPLLVPWDDILWGYFRDLAGIALYAGLGFGVGALVANQIAGIVIVLVESFVVSPLVALTLPKVGRFMPSQAANAFLNEYEFTLPGTLSPTIGGLVFLGWVVLLVAAAINVTQQRDIT